MDSLVHPSLSLGYFSNLVLAVVLAGGLCCEILLLKDGIQQGVRRLAKIVSDFRAGIYYKPFGRREPVIIRSPDLMQELSEAGQLSQRAVYDDVFGFQYNLSVPTASFDPAEQTVLRYRLFSRAIRINGLSQVNRLLPHLQSRVEKIVLERIEANTAVDAWSSINITSIMRELATGTLGLYFYGEELCQDPQFSSALARFYTDVMTCSTVFQLIPTFLKWPAYSIITNKGHSLKTLFSHLQLTAEQKSREGQKGGELQSLTLFENLLEGAAEASRYWNHTLIIQATIGMWFAASHQPWINLQFMFIELCARPDYADMIRTEIDDMGDNTYETIQNLPILDSFMKEVARYNPLDKMGIRRKALEPYSFSHGGPQVAAGEIVCVPSRELMHNDSVYPSPETFDGLRSVKCSGATKFTDATKDFPIWGLGSKACPGRWHTAIILKMILIHLLKHYDFRLEAKPESYSWFWEAWRMPYESSRILFRKRGAENTKS